jgi:hypothetical protein
MSNDTGTNYYNVAIVPAPLTGSRTLTLPDVSGTFLTTGAAVTVAQGGTGQTTYTDGQLLIGNSTGNTLTKATLTAGSGISITNGAGSITISSSAGSGTVTSVSFTGGIVSVANPTTTPALTVAGTSGGIPYFSSASTWASSAALAANALVIGGGAGVAPATTTTGTGVVTAIGNAVNTTGGLVTQSGTLAASSLLLGGGASTAISSTTTGTGVVTALGTNVGTAGAFVVNGGALGTPSSGVVTNLTGTASININGTVGATTPTTGNFTALTATSAVVTGSAGVLTRAAATQDGVELIGRAGGTLSYKVTFTPTTLTASRTLTLPDASGTILQSGTAVTVAQGGTGITTGTSGGIPYFSSTSAIASSAALTANALVIGGGAGVAPSTTTTGTGVLTALGVAVGCTGAFVTNNAANTFSCPQSVTGGVVVSNAACGVNDKLCIKAGCVGTSSWVMTICPSALTANRFVAVPDFTGTLVGDSNTQCVTSKQIVPRSSVQTGAIATLCPTPNTNDVWTVLGLSTAMGICGGSANDGEALLIRIQDNGTSRALTWASGALGYQAIGVTLPTATTINKMTYVCAIYNSCCTRWDVVQAQTQA